VKVVLDRIRLTKLDALLPPNADVTIIHLGRGGVEEDGTLDSYNRRRVEQTVSLASKVATIRPGVDTQIIWTGGCNREQDRCGVQLPASEGGAALRYASTLTNGYAMTAEEDSTSTVENATAAARLVLDNSVIIVVTDRLHYVARKVQLIFWLVFPQHRRVFVELSSVPPGTGPMKIVTHLASTVATAIGMFVLGAKRGDSDGIQRCQVKLQRITGH
jgi:hypothetical protein